MTNIEAIRLYVEKHKLHLPGKFTIEEEDGLFYISPTTPSKGGPGYYIVLSTTGDLIDPSVYGSGIGYTTLINYAKKNINDVNAITVLKENNILIGNVNDDTYYPSRFLWSLRHRPNQQWFDDHVATEAKNE